MNNPGNLFSKPLPYGTVALQQRAQGRQKKPLRREKGQNATKAVGPFGGDLYSSVNDSLYNLTTAYDSLS